MSNPAALLKRSIKATLTGLIEFGIPRVQPIVIRVLPHDPTAFTEGLAFHNDRLYEGTGTVEDSSVRRLDPDSGEVIRMTHLSGEFGEGIAVLGDRLLQLTWTEGHVHLYRLEDLAHTGYRSYEGKGWGLASHAGRLVMSDGTSTISFRDSDFKLTRRLSVTSRGIPIRQLNALSWAGDRILANLWYTNHILELSARSGRLLRIVDCAELAAAAGVNSPHSILNGIAYAESRGSAFVTGKHWPRLFEVAIPGVARSAAGR